MALKITIDIFSGRKNPTIELSEKDSVDILRQLKPTGRINEKKIVRPTSSTLGYRGLVIEQINDVDKALPKQFRYIHGDLFGENLAHKASNQDFESFVCDPTGLISKIEVVKDFSKMALSEIKRFKEIRQKLDPRVEELIKIRDKIYLPSSLCCCWFLRCRCKCAPIYEPNWWNDDADILLNNNCYNYATNYRTDTFAQPGQASGNRVNDVSHCAVAAGNISAKMGAINDSLIDSPDANNICPTNGHLVALVIWPGWDYHWYRKGRNNYWSHKPGPTEVTNLDNAGSTISDPRTADRAGYTEFCTFMVVKHGHIKLR